MIHGGKYCCSVNTVPDVPGLDGKPKAHPFAERGKGQPCLAGRCSDLCVFLWGQIGSENQFFARHKEPPEFWRLLGLHSDDKRAKRSACHVLGLGNGFAHGFPVQAVAGDLFRKYPCTPTLIDGWVEQ